MTMKKIFQKRKKPRGVALLFALGILSLLLILGLAFVSNSLLAQKAAVIALWQKCWLSRQSAGQQQQS